MSESGREGQEQEQIEPLPHVARVQKAFSQLLRDVFDFAGISIDPVIRRRLIVTLHGAVSEICKVRIDNAMGIQMALIDMIESGEVSYDTCCHPLDAPKKLSSPRWHRCKSKRWADKETSDADK